MLMKATMTVMAGVAVLVCIGVSAQQQEMLPRPGPGSGVLDVRGTVSIANAPEVRVTNIPSVTVTGPRFLEKGRRYAITWPSGDPEHVRVLETDQGGGWVRVEHTRGSRWVNLDMALALEQQ
jgi:hypothetical protein